MNCRVSEEEVRIQDKGSSELSMKYHSFMDENTL